VSVKLLKLLANLGYGSRREIAAVLKAGRVTDQANRKLTDDETVLFEPALKPPAKHETLYSQIRIDQESLDVQPGSVILLHKPVGYTCSAQDIGPLIYDLLPPRFRERSPIISSVGRLDRDTSGLLLMTDDGALLHKITSPKTHLPKVYGAQLAHALRGDEAQTFSSGTLMLNGETTPLLPAALDVISDKVIRLTIVEGRYHQIRRMFAAVGNHVEMLHRESIGALDLGGLASGQWRVLTPSELDRVFQ
jgi:16S rRNA pseudouridine516 synthase